jgi:hypothetical protein
MPQYFDVSYTDPYNYLKRPLNALLTKDDIDDTLLSIGRDILDPFLGPDIASSAIGEAVFNRKLELDGSGGEVFNPDADAITQSGQIATHIGMSIAPGVVGNLTRIYKAARGDSSRYGKQYSMKDEMMALVGSRKMTANPLLGLRFRALDYNSGKRNASRILSEQVSGLNRVSERKLKSKFTEMMTSRERNAQEMIEFINLTRSFKKSDGEIVRALRSAGVSRKDIGRLMNGVVPRWRLDSKYMKGARESIIATIPASRRAEMLQQLQQRIRYVRKLYGEYYR